MAVAASSTLAAPASSDDGAPELEAVPAPTSEGATQALEWHAPTLVRIDETCTIPRLLQDRVGRSPRRPLITAAQATRDGMRLLRAARRGELPDVDVPLIRG